MNSVIDVFGLVVAPTLPLLLLMLACVPGFGARIACWTPWAALPALLLALGGEPGATVHLEWILFGTVLGLNDLNRVFLTFSAMLWLGAGIYARGYLAGDPRAGQFRMLWLATMSGNFGLILALDVASFYAGFALMTFAGYGLVIHARTAEARRAARIYLVMAVIGEAFIITGLILAAGNLDVPLLPMIDALPEAIARSGQRDLIIGCVLLGFGVKAGLPLVHMWLPLAHPVAPIPASAVLSGAMIKAGLLGWLYILPFGLVSLPQWSIAVMIAGLAAAFGAAAIGVHQRTPKTVLAYSSISQMGLITVGVGAGLQAPALWPVLGPAIALYALHHGLAKGALFLGVGIAGGHRGRSSRRWLWFALALPGLALAGLSISGIAAKLSLKSAFEMDMPMPAWWQHLPLLLSFAAIGTTGLIARYLWLLRDRAPGHALTPSVWLGWLLVLGASSIGLVALPWLPIASGWPPDPAYLPGLLWPVLVGAILSIAAARHLRAWPVPSGDLVLVFEALYARLQRGWCQAKVTIGRSAQARRPPERAPGQEPTRLPQHVPLFDQIWRREAGLVFAALLALMLLTALLS